MGQCGQATSVTSFSSFPVGLGHIEPCCGELANSLYDYILCVYVCMCVCVCVCLCTHKRTLPTTSQRTAAVSMQTASNEQRCRSAQRCVLVCLRQNVSGVIIHADRDSPCQVVVEHKNIEPFISASEQTDGESGCGDVLQPPPTSPSGGSRARHGAVKDALRFNDVAIGIETDQ